MKEVSHNFVREVTLKIVGVCYWQETIRKIEYFGEHPKFIDDFWRKYFKILVIEKRVKRLFSRLK